MLPSGNTKYSPSNPLFDSSMLLFSIDSPQVAPFKIHRVKSRRRMMIEKLADAEEFGELARSQHRERETLSEITGDDIMDGGYNGD